MEPNWKPLESRLGRDRCVGFMYMGRVNGINRYKHGITRTYLNLDDEGHCYIASVSGCYRRTDFEFEVKKLEEALKDLDATLETSYDEVFVGRKLRGITTTGYFLVDTPIDPQEMKVH